MPPVKPPAGATDPVTRTPPKARPAAAAWTQITPAPAERPDRWPPIKRKMDGDKDGPVRTLGEPSATWLYRTADGQPAFVVCRWDVEAANGAVRPKTYAPLIWARDKRGKEAWRWQGPAVPRMLYNLDQIAVAPPDVPVLLVEGEKAADAADAYLPEGWVASTWPSGSTAAPKADFSPLRDRDVIFWPDNDKAGRAVTDLLTATLERAGHRGGFAAVPVPSALPPKWDLADDLPETTRPSDVQMLLWRAHAAAQESRGKNKRASKPTGNGAADDLIADPHGPAPDLDHEVEFVPLGYDPDSAKFFFMSRASRTIRAFSASQMLKDEGSLILVPDHGFWSSWAFVAGLQFGEGGSTPWKLIGARLMQACYDAGVYDASRIRGRGAWWDRSRIVVHLGEQLLVDGEPIAPTAIKSEHIYPANVSFADLHDLDPRRALTTTEASRLVRLCRMLRWSSPLYGDLYAGWITNALICGSLSWRPHLWVTGGFGSGKTWSTENIAAPVLGDLALYPIGNSTEAGIRQFLRGDARPVVFDEAEGEGRAGEIRRQAILELMRAASAEGRGQQLKGGPTHDPTAFRIRSMFCMISIGVGLRRASDESRCVVLTLRSDESYTPEAHAAQEAHFAKLRAAVTAVHVEIPDFGARLFSRMVGLIRQHRANTETFVGAVAQVLGGRRIGDQIGTLLAGTWALHFDTPVTDAEALKYVERRDWDEFVTGRDTREDLELLRSILAHRVRVALTNGATGERAIGELCYLAPWHCGGPVTVKGEDRPEYPDHRVTQEEAWSVLNRHGIRFVAPATDLKGHIPEEPGFLFSRHRTQHLRPIVAETDYAEDFSRVISRHPKAVMPAANTRIGGIVVSSVWLPYDVVVARTEQEMSVITMGEESDEWLS